MRIELIENSRTIQSGIISIDNLPTNILHIIIDCKNKIEDVLGNKLYSTYLYGGYAQGSSNSIYSDLDIMLFFLDEIDNNTNKDIINTQDYLSNYYKDFVTIKP